MSYLVDIKLPGVMCIRRRLMRNHARRHITPFYFRHKSNKKAEVIRDIKFIYIHPVTVTTPVTELKGYIEYMKECEKSYKNVGEKMALPTFK